ncbi:MAG: NADH:ubiquinone reductase (Na(+)-transporting) subunit F, partial [Simkaniaceae bacterium]|nr:NADH:ubiquinone reductase (Na(+)-transporting) subunit F [Simkaniaceae bacterium]
IAFVTIGSLLSSMILATKAKLVSALPCKILINEKEELAKYTPGGVTLLSALTANGISVPSPCGGKATCKQCKVKVIQGGGDILETDKATFSHAMLREGWRLSCQCKVKNDISVIVPDSLLSLKELRATVVSNENVATFIKELVLQLPEEEAFHYVSGDYLQFLVKDYRTNTADWKTTMDPNYFEDWEKFGLFDQVIEYKSNEEEVIRAYSLASYPGEGNLVKFTVRIATPPLVKGKISKEIPWGVCSSYIFSLKPGEEVAVSGPFGESHMIDDEREIVFLIGGAGASFGRSHVLSLLKDKGATRKITLWYGARSLKENIYQEDFEDEANRCANFEYRLVLSDPTKLDIDQNWPVNDPQKTNFLFKAFEEGQLKAMETPENCLYYVCGPPMHNKSVMILLDNYGVPRENIILDDFGS